jgi:arabinose-5-phosphate isomerase
MHGRDALPLVSEATPMGEALVVMSAKGFGITAITSSDGSLTGIVTDGDLRRNLGDLMSHTAGGIATRNPVTVSPDTLAAQALALMNNRKISVLIVTDSSNVPVGILHIHDCLRAGVA